MPAKCTTQKGLPKLPEHHHACLASLHFFLARLVGCNPDALTVPGLKATVEADDPVNKTYDASNFVYAAQSSTTSSSISRTGPWQQLATHTGIDLTARLSRGDGMA